MPQMPPRQAAFRVDYRQRIAPAYLGWMHVALIFGLGAAAIWVCARQITAPAWYEWLVIPAAFCLSNVFEWWIHKYVMHRPVKGLMGIYKRHTLAHHEFFTDVAPALAAFRRRHKLPADPLAEHRRGGYERAAAADRRARRKALGLVQGGSYA